MSKRFTYWNSFSIVSYLLDIYTGAAVAYSLRKIATATTNVVRIRRSSDNSERDFAPSEITDGTLTTWTGANNGFVVTWFDQSGNSNHATQSSATLQPKLVSSGVLITDNGKPAIEWDTTGTKFVTLTTELSSARSVFQVLSSDSTVNSNESFLLGSANNRYDYHSGLGGNILSPIYSAAFVRSGANYINNILTNFTSTVRPSSQSLINMIHSSSSGRVGYISKDRTFVNRSWQGRMQEVIIYETDQTLNRSGINTNINSEYTIY